MKKSLLAVSEAFDLQMIASSLIALLALVLGAKALASNPSAPVSSPTTSVSSSVLQKDAK
jgi:hypothetical protein